MEWNRNNSLWRQGHLLSEEAIDTLKLCNKFASEKTIVIVATHDCDLAQSPESEPTVEVIVGSLVLTANGNCTHAKNARTLHIEFKGDLTFWVAFDATNKLTIDKHALSNFTPRSDTRLPPEGQSIFQMWLASRYRRSAFSDEFERRLTKETKLSEKIAKAVKPHGNEIVGVFFDVDDGVEITRHGADDTYTLDIIILHAADPDFNAAEKVADNVAKSIEMTFKDKLFSPPASWKQIELRSCEPVSESVLTYQQFKQLKRWRLEHISLAANPQQPVIAQ